MNRELQIEHEISEIWFNLMQAKTSFYYAKYLYDPETIDEKDYILGSVEFQFFRTVLWKNSVIELCKLFKPSSKNDRYNFSKFINRLRKGSDLSHKSITPEIIQKWDNSFEELKPLIFTIVNLRDSVFAHSKEYKETIKHHEFLADIEKLILLSEEIIKDVFYHTFDAAAIVSDKLPTENFDILKILAKHENERRKQIIDEYKSFTQKL